MQLVQSSENNVKCKAFDQLIKKISLYPEKVKSLLDDKRLTILEKKIIEGHFLIRNNKTEEVIDLFYKLPESEIDFVKAHQHLLLGISFNNLSHFIEAKKHLATAEKIFLEIGLDYYLFSARFNLFMLHANLNQLAEMRASLICLEQTPREAKLLEIRLHRCQFMYADKSEDILGAEKLLHKIDKLKNEMAENDLIAQLVSEFTYYIKRENFEMARETLAQMKIQRKFNSSENYNFMKILLNHLTENTPVYVYDADFKNVPILHYQLKVIQSLESQDLSEAKVHWKLLQTNYPNIYGDDFVYHGLKCLFSLSLDKHITQKENPLDLNEINEGSKLKTFMALMNNATVPLLKDDLYKILWGVPAESKDDLKRLARLVTKVRNKYGLQIQSRKGTYYLEEIESNQKKKAS